MNPTVKRIVDILFQNTAENEETLALHEELMNNCQEHFQDLTARGLSEDEAIGEVVESLKGMKEVIAQYPKKEEAARAEDGNTAGEWSFSGAERLKAETTDQDLYVSPSADGNIHVYCDDPKAVTCTKDGNIVTVQGEKKREKVASAFELPEGEEVSFSGLLNMVGKAIRSVTSNLVAGPAIRIEVPDGRMEEIELSSRSGEVECSCALARKTKLQSTSGDVSLEPLTEKTAETLLVSTVSGDANVQGSALDGEVSSMSGEVRVDGVFENLRMKSTSGDVDFSGSVSDLTASSISGDVDVTVENTSLKHAEAKSTSGDVNIYLPAGLNSVHAECSTVSGSCLSRVSDAGSGAQVQIRAKSVSGDVTVQ